MAKSVNPAAIHALKEALAVVYWYKPDLRTFLTSCLRDHSSLIGSLNWLTYKRIIVNELISALDRQQPRFTDDLVELMVATADLNVDHLKRLDDGGKQFGLAQDAQKALREHVEPFKKSRDEQVDAERRRIDQRIQDEQRQAVEARVGELRERFKQMIPLEPQKRGYELENLLNELFAVFDIDAKAPFRIEGEQIDGAFTFEGEYLLEAKWTKGLTPLAEIDIFSAKVRRKLDNTLGLFVSMDGFQETAQNMRTERPVVILMDGADLMAVLEGRIELPTLVARKRQHAARTGQIFLRAYDIIG